MLCVYLKWGPYAYASRESGDRTGNETDVRMSPLIVRAVCQSARLVAFNHLLPERWRDTRFLVVGTVMVFGGGGRRID